MQKEICPPESQLKLYVDSRLSDTDLAFIKDHIKMCGKCRSSFTNLLKAKNASSSAAIQGPYFAKNETTKSDETIPEKNGSAPQANAAYPFLDPPKKHGNLGRLGGYELIRVIGEGGMGIVFEAEDEGLGRKVALKVLKPDLTDDTYKKRFAREAKVAGSLEDDHICRVYQVGQDKDISFIAMEFLQGQTLEDKLAKDGWLPIPVAFRIAREIAQGLAVAHDQNLIHRDIKPANIWLEGDPKSSDFKRVKILDFGLARGIDQDNQLTAKGMIVGTPNYMSPEQICGEKLDHKTDLFSLGCLVYRMLSGKIPFEKENTLAVLQAVVESKIPELETLSSKLPKDVLALMTKMLAKDARERPENARAVAEMIKAIENNSSGQNVKVMHSILFKSPDLQIQKSSKGNMGIIVGVISICLAIVLGVIIGFGKWGSSTPDDQDKKTNTSDKK